MNIDTLIPLLSTIMFAAGIALLTLAFLEERLKLPWQQDNLFGLGVALVVSGPFALAFHSIVIS